MTKQIPLTRGQFALVDDHWFDYLSRWKWIASRSEGTPSYYAMRVVTENGKQKAILMHRVVAKTPEGMPTDHKNHDTLDNRECNLRVATNSQNARNRRVQKNNKLGEKCIYVSSAGNYRVCVREGYKSVFDKTFQTLDEAIAARNKAVKEFHGEFAHY
jgi:hypothetical protein